MSRPRPSPIIQWPCYLRWTLGLPIIVLFVIPLCITGAIWQGLHDGYLACRHSEAWGLIRAIVVGVWRGEAKAT